MFTLGTAIVNYLGADDDEELRADCVAFLQYLENNGLDALVAGLQAQPHNNARYIEQLQSLAPEDREMVGKCARLAAAELLSDAWSEMTPEEQAAHNKGSTQKLKEETEGRPGVAVVCPPGTPPMECKKKIEEAVDAAECVGGIQVPMGPVTGCIPRNLIIGAAVGVGVLVFRAMRRR